MRDYDEARLAEWMAHKPYRPPERQPPAPLPVPLPAPAPTDLRDFTRAMQVILDLWSRKIISQEEAHDLVLRYSGQRYEV